MEKKNTNVHYLDNKDLYIEIVISKAQGKLTNKAKKLLHLIATKASTKFQNYSYEDRIDCYHTGLLDLYTAWYNFNEDKYENAFAYFTEIYKRGSARGYNEIYKKKGDQNVKVISIHSSNDGMGMHSI